MEKALRGRTFRGWTEDDFEGICSVAGEWRSVKIERIARGIAAFGAAAVGIPTTFEMNRLTDRRVDHLRRTYSDDLRVTDFRQIVEAPHDGLLSKARDGERYDSGSEEFHLRTSIPNQLALHKQLQLLFARKLAKNRFWAVTVPSRWERLSDCA